MKAQAEISRDIGADDLVFRVDNLVHQYGDGPTMKRVLGGVGFEVPRGTFMSIVGPSGAGKTTLLRSIAGLQTPTQGRIAFNGEPVLGPPEKLALVFQDYSRSLMPWLSVLDNVTLPLRETRNKAESEALAMSALREVGVAASAQQYPWQLSGGMQQRVAIARALAYQPSAILMDEPFASVDAQTRADLEDLVLSVRRHLGITVLLVTHDIDEAVYLSDKICVLSGAPARVAAMIDVDLGSERDQILTKAKPEFSELRTQVYSMIRRPDTQ